MWINLLQDHPGTWHLLASKWNDSGDARDKYFFHFGLQDSVLNLLMSEDGETFQTVAEGGSVFAEHGAVHACFTAEALGEVVIFINGVPTGAPGSFNAPRFPQISQPLIVGCKANGYPTCGDFIVDDFRMWNRPLSATGARSLLPSISVVPLACSESCVVSIAGSSSPQRSIAGST